MTTALATQATAASGQRRWFAVRHRGDWVFVALAAVHGVVVCLQPVATVVAVGVWWNLNTVAHNFIHRPFFYSRTLNRWFALYLSALTGAPQTVWRRRHLAHHAGGHCRLRLSRPLVIELTTVLTTWGAMAALWPKYWLGSYLPGYVLGLVLCALHGHFEHASGTTSHYGKLYNLLFFNDGYHCEHHARPGMSWRCLPGLRLLGARTSRWPAVLRWLDHLPVCGMLNGCERLVLHSALCQRFVIDRHARALARLAGQLPPVKRIAVVGGGLFPRTAIVVRQVLRDADVTVIDASAPNLLIARRFLGESVRWIHDWYDPRRHDGFDAVVVPLAFVGNREELYARPSAPVLFVHDWIWRRRGRGVIVSFWLLKRLNLVQKCEPPRC